MVVCCNTLPLSGATTVYNSSLTPLVAILLIVTWHLVTHLVVITELSFDESASDKYKNITNYSSTSIRNGHSQLYEPGYSQGTEILIYSVMLFHHKFNGSGRERRKEHL